MNPDKPALKAQITNDVLHISGLTPNQPFAIYNIAGTVVYCDIATRANVELRNGASLPHTYTIHQFPRSFKITK